MGYSEDDPNIRQWKRRRWPRGIIFIVLFLSSIYFLNCRFPDFLVVLQPYGSAIQRIVLAVVVATTLLPVSLVFDRCPQCRVWRPTREDMPIMDFVRAQELLFCKKCGIRLNKNKPPEKAPHFDPSYLFLVIVLVLAGIPILLVAGYAVVVWLIQMCP